ncbi:9868_t:CDS:2 [Gigaspora margarita]|uniref:9868_t:CDS:1 n=1 Tax=Gigaspora margarita TaxID=4874 RepID=A0ABN7V5A1_GIGMA|nr:9868_t:CDS:2 [Gigaspora margarita]
MTIRHNCNSYSILLDVSEPKLSTSDESTKSDYKILSIEWNTGISLKTGCKKQNRRTLTIFPHHSRRKPSQQILEYMGKLTPIKSRSTNTTTFPFTPNKLQGNVTNTINDTSNPIQSKKIRTQTAET